MARDPGRLGEREEDEPIDSTMSILVRNVTLLVFSFMMSAIVNIVPQLFLSRAAPEHKATLLPVALLSGTLAAIAGIRGSAGSLSWAHRHGARLHAGAVTGGLVAVSLAYGAMFFVEGVVTFLALNLAVRYGTNFGLNHFDRISVELAARTRRELNDRVSTTYRLVGTMLAPIALGLWFDDPWVVGGLALVSWIVLLASSAPLLTVPPTTSDDRPSGPRTPSVPLDPLDRSMLIYANLVLAAMYVFAANIVYLLEDYLRIDRPGERAGLMILLVFVAAIVTVAVRPFILRTFGSGTDGGQGVSPWRLMVPGVAFSVSIGAYLVGWIVDYPTMLGWSLIAGVGYGSFQIDLREYATRARRQRLEHGFISRYNNLANVSALVAFGSMLVSSALTEALQLDASLVVLTLVLGLSLATLPMVWLVHRQATSPPTSSA